ncbi:YbdK family carboxylate-amine ligase [Microbacterium sp. 3J1]|uniref:carboxylate-amine ligase n=1 Tax=Microbacterium sp. 3J1 TaxID=861269 RepID=UPI000B1EB4D0|nr:YbdK family carboxylate-amine ligase [Microbacterium sp. 3J1]
MARFGIEEEFILLDEETLVPLAMSQDARARIVGERAGGTISPEYLTCQLEAATSPLGTSADAAAQLRGMRALIGENAAVEGGIAVATGTPFIAPLRMELSPSEHYLVVADLLGEITREHLANGLHVHVEVPDDEERIRALNRVRAWMPTLLALTGNAPFAHGRDSGFASWRSILIRRLPTCWTPPRFHDVADYRARVDQLIDVGLIAEASSLGWTVRLAERYPTVEVRVFDAQLTVDETLFAVALTRALVLSDALDDAPDVALDAIDGSLWTAARHGADARIVDPTSGDVAPVREIADRMLRRIAPTLAAHGDEEFVTEMMGRLRTDGTGAQRQLRAWERGGVDGLRELYRTGTAQS